MGGLGLTTLQGSRVATLLSRAHVRIPARLCPTHHRRDVGAAEIVTALIRAAVPPTRGERRVPHARGGESAPPVRRRVARGAGGPAGRRCWTDARRRRWGGATCEPRGSAHSNSRSFQRPAAVTMIDSSWPSAAFAPGARCRNGPSTGMLTTSASVNVMRWHRPATSTSASTRLTSHHSRNPASRYVEAFPSRR